MSSFSKGFKTLFVKSFFLLLFCGILSIVRPEAIYEEPILNQNSRMLASVTPTMGQVIGSVSSMAYSIVLSHDGKTAFASISQKGSIQVIDITNLDSPNIFATLKLNAAKYKALALSSDGKTLFISDFRSLEVVNVSNLRSPVLIGSYIDNKHSSYYDYRPSIAVSPDDRTVFTAGHGFQVFDVSDLAKPSLLSSEIGTYSTAVLISQDTLYLADETLKVYDFSDPKSLKLLTTLSTRGEIYSMVLSSDSKTIFGANILTEKIGDRMIHRKLVVEIIDITEPKTPKSKNYFAPTIEYLTSAFVVAVSPDSKNLYFNTGITFSSTKVFDLETFAPLTNVPKILARATSVVFSQDQKIIFTGNELQFSVVRLFYDIRNSKIMSLEQNLIQNIADANNLIFTLSANGKVAFVITKIDEDTFLRIIDISKPMLPSILSSTPLIVGSANLIRLSTDEKYVLLHSEKEIMTFDVTNLSSPNKLGTFYVDDLVSFPSFSTDGKVVFLIELTDPDGSFNLRILDISKINSPKKIATHSLPKELLYAKYLLSTNGKILFFPKGHFLIYDISSDYTSLKLLSSTKLSEDGTQTISTMELSSDNTRLFIRYREEGFEVLKIYNIIDPESPTLMSPLFLPDRSQTEHMVPTSNNELLYITNKEGLIVIDISNPFSPGIIGLYQLPNDHIWQIELSQDGEKAAFVTIQGAFKAISLLPKYSLYTPIETFSLGNKYSSNLVAFKLDSQWKYSLPDQNYKLLKVSLYENEVSPSEYSLQITYSSLPNWMYFDRDYNLLTIEPKQSNHIGAYNIYAVVSFALPINAFEGLDSIGGEVNSRDLIANLIGLGYLDNERFLTLSYNPNEDLLLPSKYHDQRKEISQILSQTCFSTVTRVQVVPSLKIQTHPKKISVQTLHPNSVNVVLKLENSPNGAQAQFVTKTYSAVQSTISAKNSLLIMEGSLSDINNALQNIVIDFSQIESSYQGSMTVSDGMNPLTTLDIQDFKTYFKVNEEPKMDMNLQDQINRVPIFTGEYFIIEFDPETFSDSNDGELKYSLTTQDNMAEEPNWLNLRGLTLTGTPPEKFSPLNINLILTVKNEYKSIKVPFTITIRISMYFAMKLIAKYGGYLFTLIGIWFSINKIYNIIGKKFYIHPKKFFVEIDKEITSSTIYPIGFIAKEIRESKFIVTKLEEFAQGQGLSLLNYFVDNSNGRLNKSLILQKTQEIVMSLPLEEQKEKLYLYLPGLNSRKEIIEQLVFNELITRQLCSNKETLTKKAFDKIKGKWFKITEFRDDSGFVIDKTKLKKRLERIGIDISNFNLDNSLESNTEPHSYSNIQSQPLLSHSNGTINFSLLEDALIAYGFNFQNFNLEFCNVRIVSKQKSAIPSKLDKLKNFFKMDLWLIDFSDKGKLGYGIHYVIEDNTLVFYGTPHRNLKDQTLVVQILSQRGKILRELRINGVSKHQDRDIRLWKGEQDVL